MLASPLLQDYLIRRNRTMFLVAGERMENRKLRSEVRTSSKLPQSPLKPQSYLASAPWDS